MSSALRIARRVTLPAIPVAFVAVPTSEAQIVYTDPTDLTISSVGAMIYFDLGLPGGGAGSAATSSFAGADFRLLFDSTTSRPGIRAMDSGGLYGKVWGNYLVNNWFASKFAAGATIGDGTPWVGGGLYLTYGSNPSWPAGTTGYLGLRLQTFPATSIYYGWARVTFSGSTFTLHDFAYEQTAGTPIAAGATAIPEPATNAALTGLAALLAGSAAAYRRRQQQTAA